jgi:DUF4097 and DUF4098 domain-containing protein YvlB
MMKTNKSGAGGSGMWRSNSFAVLSVAAITVAACDISHVNGDVTANESGASTVNGSIHVPAGKHSGSLGTVNGSIRIDQDATVGSARTVNGEIEVGAHATADSLTTVNGEVTLGAGAHVSHEVTAVNGAMSLESGADVGGALKNVNGHITLATAHVGGGLHTVGGDIDVTGESHVEGGILVERPDSGWFNWSTHHPHKPRIVIGPGAVVRGDLRFEREVELYVSDRASVGPISGATAIRFSGERPTG